jgi:uncharacterized membrane protein YfcA
MEWWAAYLALGAVAGFLGGMFGIGGGTVMVPVLVMLFEAQSFHGGQVMHLALGTAMACIVFTALASLRKHHQHGAVNWDIVRRITPGILLGTALGALSALSVSPHFLFGFFACFVYFAAAQILLDLRPHAGRDLPGRAGMSAMGVFTGWLSSLVSIGGGTVVIPFLVWCNIPLRQAIGTSSAIGLPIALGGSAGYLLTGLSAGALPPHTLGCIYLPALLGLAAASMTTAPLGARAAHRLPISLLRRAFALVLLVLATKMMLKALG